MTEMLKTVSPVDGSVYVERPLADEGELDRALERARQGQRIWRNTPVEKRCAILSRAIDYLVERKDQLSEQVAWQMGRPISQAPAEVGGMEERARHMIEIAPEALADIRPTPKDGFERFIRREPQGIVAIIAPWNYPFLTSVNAVIPALAAGNAVILKPSHQTPLSAERYAEAFAAAGLPEGVFQPLHLSHPVSEKMMADPRVNFVCFTGSVKGGHTVQKAISNHFAGAGLELGGKDPAYVRGDADLQHAVDSLVDGSFFNSGQSCCGIERIYVDAKLYDSFVEAFVTQTRGYRLGNPLEDETTIGPMVRPAAADFVRGQVKEAVEAGARALVDPAEFPANEEGSAYLAPQVLVDVNHDMRVMREETFGPVAAIMKVNSDEEAISLMNDSDFGLTAAVWTSDAEAAQRIGDAVETGTFFMNRCDYLDPALAWTGIKDSGRGCTLSRLGYESLTRPKSFNLRTKL
ncbi:aldehyde dehydrogenase family protein [Fodinicurvata fenggangensis]|uniref:aldehyde dehydrogenase family protein n=1 Tax=Fodinicurvata fenggangensis TaxID=1121830 RepID=UPI00047B7618|nr:aldehyde dehydrogenase family protein [Fodinicurvata fenggangensis]